MVIVIQLSTNISKSEKKIVGETMSRSVFNLLLLSDMEPVINDPIIRVQVNMVVINPICAIDRVRVKFIKSGDAKVIRPLLMDMIGRRMANDRVVFFLNSFTTIFNNLCFFNSREGLFMRRGMVMRRIMIIPAVMKAKE